MSWVMEISSLLASMSLLADGRGNSSIVVMQSSCIARPQVFSVILFIATEYEVV